MRRYTVKATYPGKLDTAPRASRFMLGEPAAIAQGTETGEWETVVLWEGVERSTYASMRRILNQLTRRPEHGAVEASFHVMAGERCAHCGEADNLRGNHGRGRCVPMFR